MTLPEYDSHGAIVLESVAALSYEELRNWIHMALTAHVITGGEAPHDPISTLYERLSAYRLVRHDIQTIIREFVNEFVSSDTSIWRAEPGEGIFLLFEPVLLDAPARETVIVDLETLLTDETRLPTLLHTPNHRRALQGLVTLSYKGNAAFWLRHAGIGSEDVLPTIFEGLCGLDLSTAFAWLRYDIPPATAAGIIGNYLPYLIDRFSFTVLRPPLASFLRTLTDTQSASIHEYVTHEGLALSPIVDALDRRTPSHASASQATCPLPVRDAECAEIVSETFPLAGARYNGMRIVNYVRTIRGYPGFGMSPKPN